MAMKRAWLGVVVVIMVVCVAGTAASEWMRQQQAAMQVEQEKFPALNYVDVVDHVDWEDVKGVLWADYISELIRSRPTPLLIRNGPSSKVPAVGKWTPEWLTTSSYGASTNLVTCLNDTMHTYFDVHEPNPETWTAWSFPGTVANMTFKEFWEHTTTTSESCYWSATLQANVLPNFREDLVALPVPEVVQGLPDAPKVLFWIGKDTTAAFHHDAVHNFYFHVSGVKSFPVVHPRDAHLFRLHPFWHPHYRQNAEDTRMPVSEGRMRPRVLFSQLQPGDLLYIPPMWMHQPSAWGASVSISSWYDIPAMLSYEAWTDDLRWEDIVGDASLWTSMELIVYAPEFICTGYMLVAERFNWVVQVSEEVAVTGKLAALHMLRDIVSITIQLSEGALSPDRISDDVCGDVDIGVDEELREQGLELLQEFAADVLPDSFYPHDLEYRSSSSMLQWQTVFLSVWSGMVISEEKVTEMSDGHNYNTHALFFVKCVGSYVDRMYDELQSGAAAST